MRITEQDVTYVADLANLELADHELKRMVRDLNSILGYIDRLNELETSDVPPMAQTLTGAARSSDAVTTPARQNRAPRGPRVAQGAFREDEQRPCLDHTDALKNAPDTDGAFFKVPKVIEK
jgi:aspartyl-tRNA(Asn)/glutamyl-tRNA(Gln) amidotransferase subunit C